MKQCTGCKKIKPFTEFRSIKRKTTRDANYTSKCFICSRINNEKIRRKKGIPKRLTYKNRFYSMALLPNENGCMIWIGLKDKHGYGLVMGRVKYTFAHRVAYMIFKGNIPANMGILHSCDNTSCVNPSHLRAGNQQDNVNDMIKRNRSVKLLGEKAPCHKLTEYQVREIREKHKQGISQKSLSLLYHMHQSSISTIVNYKQWKHIK